MNAYEYPAANAAYGRSSSGQILVVDDEPHVLAVSRAILESQGFEVQTCSSGEEALELTRAVYAQGLGFAAVVLDLTMPGGSSGFEVLESLQKADKNITVIACSGYFQEDARDLCQAIGFYDILQKPYTLDMLCTLVRRAVAATAAKSTDRTEVTA